MKSQHVHTRKRVLIDASSVRSTADGLSTYIVSLIAHLPAESRERYEYFVLINPRVERNDLDDALQRADAQIVRAQIAGIGPRRDWQFARFLRRHEHEFDLIHVPANTYPLALKGGVCTIHDIIFKRWLDGKPGLALAARWYMSMVIGHCLRKADRIIAVSQFTKDELASSFGATAEMLERITVVHEGWEHAGAWHPGACADHAAEDYLFFLGSYRVHKNLTNLLDGFALALASIPTSKKLVVSGMPSKMSDVQREIVARINADGERVIFTGYLSEDCVARHYRDADAFILPSLSEGFGLPLLEAAYFGAPLLAANAGSLPEVAGDAALYFDPTDPAAIARTITRFYADPAVANGLREKGRALLERYSWAKAACETVAVYDAYFAERAP